MKLRGLRLDRGDRPKLTPEDIKKLQEMQHKNPASE
jgi:hypothetical protein